MSFDVSVARTTFANLILQMPTTFTWSGSNYQGVKTRLRSEDVLREAGLGDAYQFSLVCNFDDFTSLPQTGDVITINSIDYSVLNTNTSSGDITFRIDIGEYYA